MTADQMHLFTFLPPIFTPTLFLPLPLFFDGDVTDAEINTLLPKTGWLLGDSPQCRVEVELGGRRRGRNSGKLSFETELPPSNGARSLRCMTDKRRICKWQREKPGGNNDVSVHVLNMPHCSVTNQ